MFKRVRKSESERVLAALEGRSNLILNLLHSQQELVRKLSEDEFSRILEKEAGIDKPLRSLMVGDLIEVDFINRRKK